MLTKITDNLYIDFEKIISIIHHTESLKIQTIDGNYISITFEEKTHATFLDKLDLYLSIQFMAKVI